MMYENESEHLPSRLSFENSTFLCHCADNKHILLLGELSHGQI